MQIAHAANIVGSAHPNLTGVAVVDRSIEPLLQKAIAGERLRRTKACDDRIARSGERFGRRPSRHPPIAPRVVSHVQHRSQRQLHQRLHGGLRFLVLYRKPRHAEGYTLDRQVLLQKIQETVDLGGDQILMQGGLHPDFKLEWYEELLHDIKSHFPQVNVHGFSPPEIHHFTKVSAAAAHGAQRLQAAGWGACLAAGRNPRRSGSRGNHTRQSHDR